MGFPMKTVLVALLLLATTPHGPAAESPAQRQQEDKIFHPFESDLPAGPANIVDEHVLAVLRAKGIEPARPCSDEVFLRRAYLDVIGTLPEPRAVRTFLRSRLPRKRAVLIDALLEREEFADYWSLKWCDLLRVKAEFPINLWPNAVQAYHRWIRDAIRENKSYDQFVRELLTSNGSNFRVPPVNFYRAVQGHSPAAIARAVALTFMGERIEKWPDERREGMETFFSRIQFKSTAEWKEEIVSLDPAPAEIMNTTFPDGTAVTIGPDVDPRQIFADWLITGQNRWFARNIVNRIWAWLLGRGIIHEPDDIRPGNEPAIADLLDCLEEELVKADFDLRHIYRLILNSRTYQQSSIPRSDHADAPRLFASYPVRRLDAEVLIDALCAICGPRESYESPIPEPFTYIPETQRSIELADGSITSPFLEMFGRPPRDTGLESERSNTPTDAQRLHLLNSTHIQNKIERSWRLRTLLKTTKGNRRLLVRSIYVAILSRDPTRTEMTTGLDYFAKSGLKLKDAADDLVWALINSKEFLYRH